MDLTQGTPEQKNNRAKKMMLWFGIISLVMTFGGLTSAFIVSSTREDWLNNFVLPDAFTYSTIVILISSILFFFAKKAILKAQHSLSTSLLLGVLVLGIAFIYSQVVGFNQIINSGYKLLLGGLLLLPYSYSTSILHMYDEHILELPE